MNTFYILCGNTLTPVQFRRPYNPEQKQFAILFYRNYRDSQKLPAIARQLGLPESTLRRWVLPEPASAPQTNLFS